MKTRLPALACFALSLACPCASPLAAQEAQPSNYKGWDSLALSNGLLDVQVVPEVGGRVIQLRLDRYEFLFVNKHVAGRKATPTGLGPQGEWINYGGEKLWPAPQGKEGPEQWPGPPDAVLDGSPHEAAILSPSGNPAAVRLISRDDPRSGIRFSRTIQLHAAGTHVHVEATMTNIDNKPRRWGIWSVMQHDASRRDGSDDFERSIRVYCPLRADSIFPGRFWQMRGPEGHSSFRFDKDRTMMTVSYERKMGKVGIDCSAGWVATVHGSAGYVLVQRFAFDPSKKYPDNSAVEIWTHGPYGPKAAQTDSTTFPYFVESELLSPFAKLLPGESYTFAYDWYAAAIGGDFPVVDCTDFGLVCDPLAVSKAGSKLSVKGRFGVFFVGTAKLFFCDSKGEPLGAAALSLEASPLRPLLLSGNIGAAPAGAVSLRLVLHDRSGKPLGLLASAPLTKR